jgi:hypothetical protein
MYELFRLSVRLSWGDIHISISLIFRIGNKYLLFLQEVNTIPPSTTPPTPGRDIILRTPYRRKLRWPESSPGSLFSSHSSNDSTCSTPPQILVNHTTSQSSDADSSSSAKSTVYFAENFFKTQTQHVSIFFYILIYNYR